MNKNKKKALVFCMDDIEREALSTVILAFSFDVIEERSISEAQSLVNEMDIEYVLINEDKEQLIGLRSFLNRRGGRVPKFILYRKSLIHLYLKVFTTEENYTKLKIELDNRLLDPSTIVPIKNQNIGEIPNRNLLSILSHEIFTPLNSVIGFSQLLQKIEYKDSEVKTYSGFILKSGKEMQKKCSLLLDLIALRLGATSLSYSHFSIVSLFSEILEKHKTEKQSVFINVEYDYELHDVEVYTDRMKMESILERLIDNALKFTERGKVSFGFTFRKNKSLVLFVKDTGIGMSNEHMKFAFEAFWQVDSSDTRKYGGLGIGLHLVKEFVDMLNGTIVLNSEENKGTCVQVEIPFAKEVPDEKVQLEKAYS